MSYQTIRPFRFYGRMHERGDKFAAGGADPRRVQQLIETRYIVWVEDPEPEKRGRGRPKGSKSKTTTKKGPHKPRPPSKPPSIAAAQAREALKAEKDAAPKDTAEAGPTAEEESSAKGGDGEGIEKDD